MRKNMNEIDTLKSKLAEQYDHYVSLGRGTAEEQKIHGKRLVEALELLDQIARALSENRQL